MTSWTQCQLLQPLPLRLSFPMYPIVSANYTINPNYLSNLGQSWKPSNVCFTFDVMKCYEDPCRRSPPPSLRVLRATNHGIWLGRVRQRSQDVEDLGRRNVTGVAQRQFGAAQSLRASGSAFHPSQFFGFQPFGCPTPGHQCYRKNCDFGSGLGATWCNHVRAEISRHSMFQPLPMAVPVPNPKPQTAALQANRAHMFHGRMIGPGTEQGETWPGAWEKITDMKLVTDLGLALARV